MNDNIDIERMRYKFTWKIENFIYNACAYNDFLRSPVFKAEVAGSDTSEWYLSVYPNRIEGQSECHLSRIDAKRRYYSNIGFEISCITADGNVEIAYYKSDHRFSKNGCVGFQNKWNWDDMLKKKSFYFPNGSFTILCQLLLPSRQLPCSQEYLAVTHLELTKVTFQKSIHDFGSLNSGHQITCYPLPSDELEVTLFKNDDSEYLSVEFHCKASSKLKIRLSCKLNVCNYRGITLQEMENNYLFQTNDHKWKFPDFIKFDKLTIKNHYSNDTLNLQFELILHSGKIYSRMVDADIIHPDTFEVELHSYDSLSRELGALFIQKQYADVELKTEKEKFSVHKAILCTRSPVFAAMFENNMIEKESGAVNIDDVDADTLGRLLNFMYTGVVRIPDEEMAMKLMIVADKYQVLTLIEKCSAYLQSIISTENVSRLLQLADTLQEDSLKKATLQFICDQHRIVFSTDEWRQFIEHNKKLASDILQKLSERYF